MPAQDQPSSPPDKIPARFKDMALHARLSGKTAVTLRGPRGSDIQVTSVDQALTHFSVIVIEPLAKQAVVDEGMIFTWYKCRLIDIVSRVDAPLRPTQGIAAFTNTMRPDTLLPLSSIGDILVLVGGGTIVVDGVTISDSDPDPLPLQLGNQYLLLSTLASDSTVATAPLLTAGCFQLTGEDITSVDPAAESGPLKALIGPRALVGLKSRLGHVQKHR